MFLPAAGVIGWAGAPADTTKPAETVKPAEAGPPPAEYILGPDDQVKIWVLGLEEIPADKPVLITPGGDVDLPGVGQVHAAGLTVEQFKARLVERFSKELLHPEVSVELVDFGSQPVSVMGAVNHPGVYQLRGRKTLTEVVSLAEGLRVDAGPSINISRPVQYGAIPLSNAKPDQTGTFSVAAVKVKELMAGEVPADNIRIQPHDVITVPIAEVVYVMGDVQKPGEVPLKDRDRISVLQALAFANGLGPQPAPQKARIVRLAPHSTSRQEIPVDLRKVQDGKAEDLDMRPNDILVVPQSGSKRAAVRAVEAAITTVSGVIIWHGI